MAGCSSVFTESIELEAEERQTVTLVIESHVIPSVTNTITSHTQCDRDYLGFYFVKLKQQ